MSQDDTNINEAGKVQLKIPIPAINEEGLKGVKRWAKKAYRKARIQVNWKKAQKIKEMMPIETAAYAERKVFGNWRLVAPYRDTVGAIHESPLQTAIRALRPYIVQTRWGEFRREFVKEIKLCFNAICDADYDPKMVEEVNKRLDELLRAYCHACESRHPDLLLDSRFRPILPKVPIIGCPRIPPQREERGGNDISCHFVLKPETAEDYSSLKNLTTRSGIWMRWTGKPLDFSMFIKSPNAQPISRQMEMYLEVII